MPVVRKSKSKPNVVLPLHMFWVKKIEEVPKVTLYSLEAVFLLVKGTPAYLYPPPQPQNELSPRADPELKVRRYLINYLIN